MASKDCEDLTRHIVFYEILKPWEHKLYLPMQVTRVKKIGVERSWICDQRLVLVSGRHLGPMIRFYMFFSLTCTCFFMQGALSDKRTGLHSAVHITHWSESQMTHNHILLSHLSLNSLFVASYDSQGYSGGILTRLHTGLSDSDY
jgi:hypothetical protein